MSQHFLSVKKSNPFNLFVEVLLSFYLWQHLCQYHGWGSNITEHFLDRTSSPWSMATFISMAFILTAIKNRFDF